MTYLFQSDQDSVPRDLPMKHDFPPVLIDLDYRITPTEIRVQVVETDRHLHRGYRRQKPCRIYEHHSRSPIRNAFFARFLFVGRPSLD